MIGNIGLLLKDQLKVYDQELTGYKKKQGKNVFSQTLTIALSMWFLILYLLTELLSVFHQLNSASITASWSIVCLMLAIWFFSQFKRENREHGKQFGEVGTFASDVRSVQNTCVREGKLNRALSWMPILATIFVCVLAGYLAYRTVPYNWDSMAYHLARIMHWLQNDTVSHYATNIDRQVFSPPFAEFIMLHVFALCSAQDILINFVQCTSLWISTYFVYTIAEQLGCSRGISGTAALLFATTPIAFAESLTTQVDLVSTIFALMFVSQAIQIIRQKKPILDSSVRNCNIIQLSIMSLSIGLGYLTKPSVCLIMVVFLFPILSSCIRRKDSIRIITGCFVGCGIVSAVLAVPELMRMWGTYRAFTNSEAGAKQMIGTIIPAYVLVNFMKNFFFNLPNIYMTGLPIDMQNALEKLSKALCVPINDLTISEGGRAFRFHVAREYGHDTAINPLLVWGWIAAWIWLLLFMLFHIVGRVRCYCKQVNKKKACNECRADDCVGKQYFVISSICFLLFLGIMRWEIYETRYEIPYLALLCPAIMWAVVRPGQGWKKEWLIKIRKGWVYLACAGVIALCLHQTQKMFLFHQNIADIQNKDRLRGYYWWWEEEYDSQSPMCERIKEQSYRSIGLYCDGGYYEYPVWEQLQGTDIRIEHIQVDNLTEKYENETYIPDAVMWMGSPLPDRNDGKKNVLTYHSQNYIIDFMYDETHILLKRENIK